MFVDERAQSARHHRFDHPRELVADQELRPSSAGRAIRIADPGGIDERCGRWIETQELRHLLQLHFWSTLQVVEKDDLDAVASERLKITAHLAGVTAFANIN